MNDAMVIFGMELDGASWSGGTSVNKYVCGPQGLLKYLETRAGRLAKAISAAARTKVYRDKIVAAKSKGANLWCAGSFEADAWSTATQMLKWRDQVKGLKLDLELKSGVSRRFDDILAIEAAGDPLPEGLVDRAVALLPSASKLDATVRLVCPAGDLPYLWNALIQSSFAHVVELSPAQAKPEIEIVRAHDEVALSREFARWLAAERDTNGRVTLVVDGDSSLLDGELQALGLPRIGRSTPSASRQTLQLLPDAVTDIWRGRSIDEAASAAELEAALDRADRALSARLGRDELAKVARLQVSELRALTCDQVSFPRAQLLRLLEAVIAGGSTRPGAWQEVGCPRVVTTPEAMFSIEGDADYPQSDYVLWWDFTDRSSETVVRLSAKEAEVAGTDRVQHDAAALRRRELWSWRLAVSNTTRKLVLFAPHSKDGADVALHPLYDYLVKDLGEEPVGKCTREASSLVDGKGTWSLADRKIDVLEKVDVPVRRFEETVPLPAVTHVPETVSQSQMEMLISCPFAWYHRYYLGLRPSPAANVESEAVRTGKHAHKVIEELAKLGVREEAEVGQGFDAVFDAALGEFLPELQEPEAVARLEKYRATLRESVLFLWRRIRAEGLTVIGCEVEKSVKDYHGSELHGFIDMVLRDRDGNTVIYDFKWSRGQKRYEDMVRDGKSIQFAVYHHLLGGQAKCSYYLLPLMKFIEDTQDNVAVFRAVDATYEKRLGEVMTGKVCKAIVTGLEDDNAQELANREAEVAAAGLAFDVPAKCVFCEFNELCGRPRQSKEAWG